MIFKYGVIFFAAAVCGGSALPSCVCTRNYAPVCGSNDRTYPNECMLNCARLSDRDLALAHTGTCDQPTCICTFEYKPICGSDGKTYGNECSLNCQRTRNPVLERRYEGPCRSEEIKVAELPELSALPACACTRELSPVCGTDGETYATPCRLRCAAQSKPDLSVKYSGPCDGELDQVKVVEQPLLPSCACTRNLEPVCGTDGVTYSNPCLLSCSAQTNTDLAMDHFGPCDENDHQVKVVEQPLPSSCACTRNLQPVCGTNGVTYSNPCLLRCSAQTNSDLTIDHFGPCDEDDDQVKVVEQPLPSTCSCTRNLEPVCGTDGVTYNNPCLLRCAAQSKPLTLKAIGPCDDSVTVDVVEQPREPASCVCTRNYAPVCGSDEKTYSNPCMLRCATNQNPDLKMFHVGPCSENLQVHFVQNPVY